jgi:hypothetical protein
MPKTGRAKELAKRWGLAVQHSLYSKTGDFYHHLKQFPGALLDPDGYVVFESDVEFKKCPQLQIRGDANRHGGWVDVPQGIKAIPGYVVYPAAPVGGTDRSLAEIGETERDALIQARLGQGRFRTDVIALWGSCAVTGCSMFSILMASHIVPWAKCETNKERLDPFNGLLLTPNLDKLFDQGLISFKNDGTVLLSKELGAEQRTALGVTERSRLRFVRPTMIPYLKRHRDLFSKKLRTRNTGAK